MRRIEMGLILLLALTASVCAQQAESLLIGPGDMLHVQVFDTPELEQHARVSDAGEILLLVGGDIKVAFLTPNAASHLVEKALLDGHFLLHPRVSITVEEYATQRVSVLGEVKTPGAYLIGTPRSVLDVLTMAGGLSELADRKILIERHGSGEKIPYFVSNTAKVALDTAVKVCPGDTVVVPRASLAYVLGDVKLPGGYTMTNNAGQLTILELVARAGGTNHSAVPSHARLIHRTANGFKDEPLPLSDMQKGKLPDLPLAADDIVYVPFSYVRNTAVNLSALLAAVGSATVYHF